ncbi:MAG: geranylgeranylglyceryl/heptaprenylglyceryl phosphate synthase [Thermoplasmata archaeon]|nr:geranylgeranylglyceryl/heptaprenylglyceryl phosphate synthase [Thermoplasmata archaeon]
MTVIQKLREMMKAEGTLHVALIDPDKQTPEEAADIARRMLEAGSNAVFIGGSTGVTNENLTSTTIAIKEATGLPVILFPGTPNALSKELDAVLFMSMMNSTDVNWIMGAQVYAAPILRQLGVETIPMGYVIVEPGMKVGEVGKADPIKRDDIKRAVAYAMTCEMMGMSLVYFEAGSGAPTPIPPEMIRAIKSSISIPLIIGGGIRTPEAAAAAREAGADIVVTGTLLEQCHDDSKLKAVVAAARGVPQ